MAIPPEIQTTIDTAVSWLWEKYGKETAEATTSYQIALYEFLDQHFNVSELKDLCIYLGLDYENLGGDGKKDKARELVQHSQRHGSIEALTIKIAELRPKISWASNTYHLESEKAYETQWRKSIEKYYAELFRRVGFVRILGRMEAEPLENVFTHVNVMDKLTAEQWYDIARLTAEFNPRDFGRLERVRRIAGDEAVAEFPKLFILGKPGAGKTTFLKHTALRAIKHEIKKVPLFVTLKELSDTGMAIVPFMTHQLTVHRFPEPEAFLERLLEKGDALVLFDGLDEVNLADNKRDEMIRQVNDFVYRYSDCPTLMTCRVAATDYSFTQFEYVEMADFDEAQMRRYIDLWFVGDTTKRENFKKVLLKDDAYKPVRELAQVPLLLALLCLVYEERNEIPPERHEIYGEATRALLSKWDASRNINRDVVYQQLAADRKQKMLATIAAQTFEKGDYFLKEKDVERLIADYLQGVPKLEEPDAALVLESLEAQHGIFVERARGIHSFSHLTLQEYFTARYIVDNEQRGTVNRLMRHVGDERWNEVFLLVAGMLDDATEFAEQYLAAAYGLLGDDATLQQLLLWGAQKATAAQAGFKPVARRAFVHFRARAVGRRHALNLAFGSIYARTFPRGDPNLDLYLALDLAFVLDLNLYLALDLAIAFNVAPDFDTERVVTLARSLALAVQVAERQKLSEMDAALRKLAVPKQTAKKEVQQELSRKLVAILDLYEEQWNPYRLLSVSEEEALPWKDLSEAQIEAWTNYLKANLLLVRCLQVAYLPNRQAIEDKILLPPTSG